MNGGTARLAEGVKVLPASNVAADMFLVVAGTAETAVIRFEGSKQFLDIAVQAVERLVDDIMEVEREDDPG